MIGHVGRLPEADIDSDGHDKPFCTKATTIIDNFNKALGDTDKSQFLKAISVIDKLSPMNFSDKCCGKFSMCLTNIFLQIILQKCFSRFFDKREQFKDFAMAFNKTKRDFSTLRQDLMDTVCFFPSANLLTLKFEHCECKQSFIAITKYITKAISVIDKSKLI